MEDIGRLVTSYDSTSPRSIEAYAKKLIGYTFDSVIRNMQHLRNLTAMSLT